MIKGLRGNKGSEEKVETNEEKKKSEKEGTNATKTKKGGVRQYNKGREGKAMSERVSEWVSE